MAVGEIKVARDTKGRRGTKSYTGRRGHGIDAIAIPPRGNAILTTNSNTNALI